MNDTNELDNYGVWVKKPPMDINSDPDSPDMFDESLSLDIDFPDFNELEIDSTEDTKESDILDTNENLDIEDINIDNTENFTKNNSDEDLLNNSITEAIDDLEENLSIDENINTNEESTNNNLFDSSIDELNMLE